MKIARFDVQPILLHIENDKVYEDRFEQMKRHLEEVGIHDTIFVSGVNAKEMGVIGTHTYELDNPNGGHMIGQKYTGSFLSQYVVYNVMNVLPNEYFMFFECDTVMPKDFLRKLEFEMFNLPSDFDFLFVHSCCQGDKQKEHIGGNTYKFPKRRGYPVQYPLSGSCYIVSKKSIPHILATQRDAYAPSDINLGIHTFYNMDVYSIFPRICEQKGNENLEQ